MVLGVIPARYGSTRFPGKPLAPILGRPMIQWVYEGARTATRLHRLIVATDDERILAAVRGFGAEAIMTSPDCPSGTDRAGQVAEQIPAAIIVNIQGDEPLLRGAALDALIQALETSDAPMASLMARAADPAVFRDPGVVKVVVSHDGDALYFSRSPVPSSYSDYFYRHIGIYAYRRDFLRRFRSWPPSRLEKAERLEQLRALENGAHIRMVEADVPALSVDNPDDIIKVEDFLRKHGHG